jgi:hypothetical protein
MLTFKQFIIKESLWGKTKDLAAKAYRNVDRYKSIYHANRLGVHIEMRPGTLKGGKPSWNLLDIENLKGKKGAGTKALDYILHNADKHKIPVDLIAGAPKPENQERLQNWYKRHGFQSSDPKYIMHRDPQKGNK